MLSGLFAGLAGVLYAVQNRFAAPDFVFFVISGEVVIFNVMGGMGTAILSTSVGVMTGHEAKQQGVGGEVVAYIW